jgi:predicted RecB family nuclease
MQRVNGSVMYSATDLLTWYGCAHASHMDALALSDRGLQEWLAAQAAVQREAIEARLAFPDPSGARGDAHEAKMLTGLKADPRLRIKEIPRPGHGYRLADAARDTEAALAAGYDVVYQAALVDGPWFGYADFLVRVDGQTSKYGTYAYEVRDTKLAQHPSARALLQMAHYGSILETLQGAPPPRLVVWLGNGEEFQWPYRDALPYLEEMRRRFRAFHEGGAVGTEPEPVDACGKCRWSDTCKDTWGPQDLTHVYRLSRRQRRMLRDSGITTVAELAHSKTRRPEGMAPATFERLQAQAAVQTGKEPFELVRPQPRLTGVAGTPAPHDLDIYFDLEGDPYVVWPTLDYLWAYCDADDTYEHRWAHDQKAEREAFRWFLDELERRETLGGDWRVYHYNSYEISSMERLAKTWPVEEEREHLVERVAFFVQTRFDDLYRRVEAGLRMRDGRTSLKYVEKVAGYERDAEAAAVGRADQSIEAYEAYLQSDDEEWRAELLEGLRQYNEHDVRATRAVHHWLHGLAGQLTDDHLTDPVQNEHVPSADAVARVRDTEALRVALETAADEARCRRGSRPPARGCSPRCWTGTGGSSSSPRRTTAGSRSGRSA